MKLTLNKLINNIILNINNKDNTFVKNELALLKYNKYKESAHKKEIDNINKDINTYEYCLGLISKGNEFNKEYLFLFSKRYSKKPTTKVEIKKKIDNKIKITFNINIILMI